MFYLSALDPMPCLVSPKAGLHKNGMFNRSNTNSLANIGSHHSNTPKYDLHSICRGKSGVKNGKF